MEILGIGASELVFILLIAVIVMGPKQMKEAGRTIGHLLNRFTTSDFGKILRDTSQEISNLPRKWMRDANMELWEAEQDVRNSIDPRPRKPESHPIPKTRPTPHLSNQKKAAQHNTDENTVNPLNEDE